MNDLKLYENISELVERFPIKVRKYSVTQFTPHWHEHIEILYVLSGGGRFFCNAKASDAHSGETVFVNSGELHSFSSEEVTEYICIIINPTLFSYVNYGNVILKSKIPNDSAVTKCIERIYGEYEKADSCSNLIIMGETCLLMAHLVKNYTEKQLSQYEYDTRMARLKKVNMILDFIHEHYSEPITTSMLAHRHHFSESHMCRIFKNAVGVTVTEYINGYRTDKAAMLLKNTDESVSDISESVGFDNLNYFDRVFKKHKGLPPKEYRNNS